MNFKEALIAHLHGEKVEARAAGSNHKYRSFVDMHKFLDVSAIIEKDFADLVEYRLAPRTIMCNGVEVPAPEKEAPSVGSVYYIPCVSIEEMYKECVNNYESIAKRHADMDILYLNKEDAIARAKAMLLTQE